MKQLTLVPEGGLCNRIYAVTSAIVFAKNYNLQLTVIWFKDWGMGAGFHDLFTLPPTVKNVEIKDASFLDFFKYAKPIKSNFFIPKLYQKLKFDAVYFWYEEHVSVEKWYNINASANKLYLFHCQQFYDNYVNLLSPINSIQRKINEQLKLLSPNTIGIHIRRADLTSAIMQSPLSEFIERIQQEIATDPDAHFYVASDSPEEKKNLINIFGHRIITVEYNLKRNTKDGVIDALIELYTLATTKKIYGSFQSSYSFLASKIYDRPIDIIQKNIIKAKK
ncbi:MAG: hypothetical protein FWD60_09450 [Candidatus Azobacteroides sp.]|nr:hypothetical protein [Candidatus Azobacteroides sp.]